MYECVCVCVCVWEREERERERERERENGYIITVQHKASQHDCENSNHIHVFSQESIRQRWDSDWPIAVHDVRIPHPTVANGDIY